MLYVLITLYLAQLSVKVQHQTWICSDLWLICVKPAMARWGVTSSLPFAATS
jgi:hypothetical protein